VILPCTREDLELFGRRIQYAPTTHARGIKVVDNNDVKVVIAYDNWTMSSVQMHFWIGDPKYFTRRVLREAFGYPFSQCGRTIVVGVIPSDNEESISIATRAGFVEAYRFVGGWDEGVDLVMHTMHKNDCKWLADRGTLGAAGATRPTSRSLRMANG